MATRDSEREVAIHTLSRRSLMTGGLRLAVLWSVVGASLAEVACGGSSDEGMASKPPAQGTPERAAGESAPAAPSAEKGAAGGPAEPQASGSEDERLVTEIPDNADLVASLHYTNKSVKPDQHCGNCFFFTSTSADRGKCQLFASGRVSSSGWCASWQKKPTS